MSSSTPLRNIDWACERLGASRDSIYAWVRSGFIPHCKIGRRVFFDEDQIEAFIARGGEIRSLPPGLNAVSPDDLEHLVREAHEESAS
jgi:excisionase family DNA binding protein